MGRVLIVQNQEYVGIKFPKIRGDEKENDNVTDMKTTLGKMGFTDACIEDHKNKTKAEMIRLLEDGKYIYINLRVVNNDIVTVILLQPI